MRNVAAWTWIWASVFWVGIVMAIIGITNQNVLYYFVSMVMVAFSIFWSGVGIYCGDD